MLKTYYRLLLKKPGVLMKDFVIRYSKISGYPLSGLSLVLAVVLTYLYHNYWFLFLIIPALLGALWPIFANREWICTCVNCGKKFFDKGYSYCPKCKIRTLIRRRFKIICPIGHKIRENEDNQCPECIKLGIKKTLFPKRKGVDFSKESFTKVVLHFREAINFCQLVPAEQLAEMLAAIKPKIPKFERFVFVMKNIEIMQVTLHDKELKEFLKSWPRNFFTQSDIHRLKEQAKKITEQMAYFIEKYGEKKSTKELLDLYFSLTLSQLSLEILEHVAV